MEAYVIAAKMEPEEITRHIELRSPASHEVGAQPREPSIKKLLTLGVEHVQVAALRNALARLYLVWQSVALHQRHACEVVA
jgi:hypothetical protein